MHFLQFHVLGSKFSCAIVKGKDEKRPVCMSNTLQTVMTLQCIP